jgi:hypothetical protein
MEELLNNYDKELKSLDSLFIKLRKSRGITSLRGVAFTLKDFKVSEDFDGIKVIFDGGKAKYNL